MADVDAEAAMLAGLMRLRGEGCAENRDLAEERFDRCRAIKKRPGEARRIAAAADYVDLALALGWGGEDSLYKATEQLLQLGDNSGFEGQSVALQFSLDDANALRDGNPAFAAIGELKSLGPEFGKVPSTGLFLDALLTAVLSTRRFAKIGVTTEVAQKVSNIENRIPEDSMVWNFFLGQLM